MLKHWDLSVSQHKSTCLLGVYILVGGDKQIIYHLLDSKSQKICRNKDKRGIAWVVFYVESSMKASSVRGH